MNGTPIKILLIEDHEDTLNVLARLLSRRGFSVTPALSVHAAKTAAAAGKFDLVVSDIGLPDGNGYELMSYLKSTYGLRGISVSGHTTQEDLDRAQRAGFEAHLPKPVVASALLTTIESFAVGEDPAPPAS